MQFAVGFVGLLAATVSAFKYVVPVDLDVADDCTLPSQYTITDFSTYIDVYNGTKNLTEFNFADQTTGISTYCSYNLTSKPSLTVGTTSRYPCDDPYVEFIDQKKVLTIIERACPESGSAFEATGITTFNLTCISACIYPPEFLASLPSLPSEPITSDIIPS